MSYLDDLRMNFSGTFFAQPSTINNVVENYNLENWPSPCDPESWDPMNIQFVWNPMGGANFTFKDCSIKSIGNGLSSLDNSTDKDTLIEQSITIIEKPFPGKIVDLDPQQQGTSGLFGVQILIGTLDGPYVMGNFEPTAFRDMWSRVSSGCGGFSCYGGMYESTLTNLVWNEKGSKYLEELKRNSPDRLSIKFALDLFNGTPELFIITGNTEQFMIDKGIPNRVIDKLKRYSKGSTPNNIPTKEFFEYLLEQYLTSEQLEYKDKIISLAKQPYTAGSALDSSTPLDFTQGRVVGAIGPSSKDDPIRSSWYRMLNPYNEVDGQAFSPFILSDNKITLDLSNTLPNSVTKVNNSQQVLGEINLSSFSGSLTFGYYENQNTSNFIPIKDLTQKELNKNLLLNKGGILEFEVEIEQAQLIQKNPCMIIDGNKRIVLKEQKEGINLMSESIAVRLNPGFSDKDRGGSHVVDICVSQFGRKKEGIKVFAKSVSPEDTDIVFGVTGEDPHTGTPPEALSIDAKVGTLNGIEVIKEEGEKIKYLYVQSDARGRASFILNSSNPNNARGYIDGQLYYISYALSPEGITIDNTTFGVNMNGVNVLIFDKEPMVDRPTWDKDIGPFMSQYGHLYPVMRRFNLGDFDVVTKYSQTILDVMSLPIDNPNHMPVTRDLSLSRLALFRQWVNTGMARS